MKRRKAITLTESSEHQGPHRHVDVEAIVVPERIREVCPEAVSMIAQSMTEIGLLTPITVIYPASTNDQTGNSQVPILVAGAHRLESAKALGWKTIPCLVMDNNDVSAEMWQIAENLHRRDLTKQERDQHIRRYARLLEERETQSGQAVPFESQREDGKGHRKKGITSKIADEMGVSKRTVHRALASESSDDDKGTARAPRSTEEVARSRLMKAWDKAGESDRRWFLSYINEPEQGNYLPDGAKKEAHPPVGICCQPLGETQ